LLISISLAAILGSALLTVIVNSGILSRWGTFRIVDRTLSLLEGNVAASQDTARFTGWSRHRASF